VNTSFAPAKVHQNIYAQELMTYVVVP
jgi:hypothetical protein